MTTSSSLASPERNKEIYTTLHDAIIAKRFESGSPIRRHAHRSQYQAFVDLIPAGASVLDAGCGEGVLSVLLAKKGCIVTGFDISAPNIDAAKAYAQTSGVSIQFLLGDTEHVPVADHSFDYVVSSHVLEHVPDFAKAASELSRIARKQIIIAIPTCLSLGAMALLGGDKYWTLSRRSFYAVPYGFLRIVKAFFHGDEGVNEGYEGNMELIHIWRFPWVGKRKIEEGNLRVIRYGCSAIIVPYFSWLLPLARLLEKCSWCRLLHNFGHGTTYVCEPVRRS